MNYDLVRDINDNAPIFRPAEIDVTLSEGTQIGATDSHRCAEDRDENRNFSIESASVPIEDMAEDTGSAVTTLRSTTRLTLIFSRSTM
ncbi:unnamed protein product, partial [Mesorhabditis belari]|uniref:Cadherin domain-containing protein n=1 Tax=Mesorhabditis belari TaxID=2138241 RepID=A0AAF3FLE1_9BILA